jgi:hypothetical protein
MRETVAKSASGFSPLVVLLLQLVRQSASYDSCVMILSGYAIFTMFGNQFWCDHSRKSSSVSEGLGVRASVHLPSPIDPAPAPSGVWLLLLTSFLEFSGASFLGVSSAWLPAGIHLVSSTHWLVSIYNPP